MIGEKVALMKGIAQNKALPAVNGMPAMETTAQGQGIIAGIEGQFFATYSATMQADGSFYGECPNSGIVMTANGPATFRATGAGTPTAEGGFKFRGACYFQSSAEQLLREPPLPRLVSTVAIAGSLHSSPGSLPDESLVTERDGAVVERLVRVDRHSNLIADAHQEQASFRAIDRNLSNQLVERLRVDVLPHGANTGLTRLAFDQKLIHRFL